MTLTDSHTVCEVLLEALPAILSAAYVFVSPVHIMQYTYIYAQHIYTATHSHTSM